MKCKGLKNDQYIFIRIVPKLANPGFGSIFPVLPLRPDRNCHFFCSFAQTIDFENGRF